VFSITVSPEQGRGFRFDRRLDH